MDKEALYEQRQAGFLKEIRPYLHYALQGMTMTAVITFFALSIGYKYFLQWVTPDFPWKPLAALVLLPFLAGGRIRTYLQEADLIFLLPLEMSMERYIQTAQRKALIVQGAGVAAAWLLVWPVYAKLTGAAAWTFFLLLVIWVLFKAVLLYGRWTELQLQEDRTRLAWTLLRWAWGYCAAYTLLAFGLGTGLLLLAAGSLVYVAALRRPRRYTIYWLRLIELEQRHRASLYRVLNWFVDVPPLRVKARNVRGITAISHRLPFQRSYSYHYLYSLVFFRSELFGIALRLLIIGSLLIASVSNEWAKLGAYLVFALVGALQLADLKRYYPELVWHRIYPLPHELKKRAVSTVRFLVHAVLLIVWAVPLIWTLSLHTLWGAMLAVGAAAVSFLYHRKK